MTPSNPNKQLRQAIEKLVNSFGLAAAFHGINKTNPLPKDPTDEILALSQNYCLALLQSAMGGMENTHWSACNNHGVGKPTYKCVCGNESRNQLRTQALDNLKQKLEIKE